MAPFPQEQASFQPDRHDRGNDSASPQELFARSPIARYLNLAAICADGICITDAQGKILFVNGALLRLLGYEREDQIVGKAFPSKHWADPAEADALWGEVWREGVIRDHPLELRDQENRPRIVSLSAACTKDESGEVIDVQFVLRDQTDARIEANQLERQHDALRQVRASAHELSQPLTVIVGYSSLLLRLSQPDDANRRILESIARSAREIEGTIKRMGQVAREASSPPLSFDEGAGAAREQFGFEGKEGSGTKFD